MLIDIGLYNYLDTKLTFDCILFLKPKKSLQLKWQEIGKEGVVFNKHVDVYEGFVNLGENIVYSREDDAIASEALVFMLSALRSHWKYPIRYGYKIDAETLNCLLSQALRIATEDSLKIRTITCDGTSTNISAMEIFDCILG